MSVAFVKKLLLLSLNVRNIKSKWESIIRLYFITIELRVIPKKLDFQKDNNDVTLKDFGQNGKASGVICVLYSCGGHTYELTIATKFSLTISR